MTTQNTNITATETSSFASAEDILNEWMGHRRLTRRVIEAFPEDKLFDYSIGGMRTFAEMIKELLDIAGPGIKEIVSNKGGDYSDFSNHTINEEHRTKEALLKLWDQSTDEINTFWPQISQERFQENIIVFGKYEGQTFSTILYFIDNEIHHRAQGTVYLRSLGVEPPAFWNRD